MTLSKKGDFVEDRKHRFGIDPYRGQLTNVWQGTVISKKDEGRLQRRMVISADCDLTDEKGNQEFFTLDIVPIEEFVIHAARGAAIAEIRKIILQSAREIAIAKQPSFFSVSDEVLSEWILAGDSSRWSVDLPGIHSNEKDLLESIKRRLNCCEFPLSECALDASELLLKSDNSQLSARVDAINKKIRKELQSRLLSTRVDHYIFPSLPGEYETLGHVVPFKSLKLMSKMDLSFDTKEVGVFVPVATCRPVLLQSLLQKMTNYFARIGLTDSFRDEQETIVKTMMEVLK